MQTPKTYLKTLTFLLMLTVINSFEISASATENYIPPYFLNGSKLIENNHRQMLYNWINYGNPRTQLLWRGSQHNFNWDNMHENTENWGSVLVVIKTKQNYLFGGFISQGIKGSKIGYSTDKKAFIFSLTKGTVHYQRNKTANCIFHDKQYISFGGRPEGHWDDISLRSSCNVDYYSYSDFGWTFISPDGIIPGSIQAQAYMAGNYRWMCSDVQIWAVIDA